MGIQYGREYSEIIKEISAAIMGIEDLYDFIDMSSLEWINLSGNEQEVFAQTIADDIIYALGYDPVLNVGSGMIKYDKDNGIVKVYRGKSCIHLVKLF